MQQLLLHKKVYQVNKIDETEYSKKVYERLEKIRLFDRLKKEGCSAKTAFEVLKMPQSTLYRWKKNYRIFGLLGLEEDTKRPQNIRKPKWNLTSMQKILELRRKNPLYGKAKIAVLLKRDHGIKLPESTVGRIIAYYIKRNQIKPAFFYYKKKRIRPRAFNKHAQRWKYGMKANNPGELFQIDHMTVSVAPAIKLNIFRVFVPLQKWLLNKPIQKLRVILLANFLSLFEPVCLLKYNRFKLMVEVNL